MPEKLTVKFLLKNDIYHVSVEEYPFIYGEGSTLISAFENLIELLKNDMIIC